MAATRLYVPTLHAEQADLEHIWLYNLVLALLAQYYGRLQTMYVGPPSLGTWLTSSPTKTVLLRAFATGAGFKSIADAACTSLCRMGL